MRGRTGNVEQQAFRSSVRAFLTTSSTAPRRSSPMPGCRGSTAGPARSWRSSSPKTSAC